MGKEADSQIEKRSRNAGRKRLNFNPKPKPKKAQNNTTELVSDMLSYRDLFDYFKRERIVIIRALENMSNEEFTKNRGLSFDSIKGVFAHTVMVEDNWLHWRMAGLGLGTQLKLEDFKNLQDIKKYMTEVDEKTSKFFKKLTEQDLEREFKVIRPDGTETVERVENALYHIPIEVVHHYGEIFAEFWKMGINAPYYSYLNFSKDRVKGI